MTPYEAGNYESDGRRFEKIVRFATVDCVKAGWILKQKGRWSITDEGKAAYNAISDPGEFYSRAVTLYQRWKKNQESEEESTEADEEVSPKTAAITLEEAEESAWAEIQQFVGSTNPYDFQDLVGALLRGLGYFIVRTAPPGKDGGVDLIRRNGAAISSR